MATMTQPQIIGKLGTLLERGIATEAEAVYFMAAIRKLLEQQQAKKQYEYLTFHCDWALHSTLKGTTAQKILTEFDAASIHLRTGIHLHELPPRLEREIDRISKMKAFEQELNDFLQINGLPGLNDNRADGWIHFHHLYARIVEDCPLVITAMNNEASIASVTLHVELAKQIVEGEQFFKVSWEILDKKGQRGDIYIINSFSLNPVEAEEETE
jgi:hypothetical protein